MELYSLNDQHIRTTREVPRRVSVLDLIKVVTKSKYERDVWRDLREHHPEVVAEVSQDFQFPGQGQRATPVTDVRGVVIIINLLPGKIAANFRACGADIIVRYLGGDESLISEIKYIRSAQQGLPKITTPARGSSSKKSKGFTGDYHAVLGVDLDASLSDLRGAYIREAVRCHPSFISREASSEQERHITKTRFRLLATAYDTLSERAAQLKSTPAPLMPTSQALVVFLKATLQSVREERLGNAPTNVEILKIVASLSLTFTCCGEAMQIASNALSLLLFKPSEVESVLAELSFKQRRELHCAVLRLGQFELWH